MSVRNLLRRSLSPTSLGRLGDGGNEFSWGDRYLLTWEADFSLTGGLSGDAALRDMQADMPRTAGRRLRADICAASGDRVRPFPPDLRMNTSSRLYPLLHGRPWNPCDWRGLGAIWPSRTFGDGWFEGARQWWRLVRVRYFRAADYACPETTSRAASATRAARQQMCERFGSRPA